jgi:hypothetical protein
MGQVYNAWIQIDFKETDKNGNYHLKHFHSNYGFDLEKELAKHPIKELTNEQNKIRLLESLQKGNRQSVVFIKDGNEQKVFIEANPRFKTINVYDHNMQRLNHNQAQKEKHGEGERNTAKQASKNDTGKQKAEDEPGEAQRHPIKEERSKAIL